MNPATETVPTLEPLLVGQRGAQQLTDLGRSTLLKLAYSGVLPTVKVGRRRLFTVAGLRAWVAAQVAAADSGQHA